MQLEKKLSKILRKTYASFAYNIFKIKPNLVIVREIILGYESGERFLECAFFFF